MSSLVYARFKHWTSNTLNYKGKAERLRIITDFELLSIEERVQVAKQLEKEIEDGTIIPHSTLPIGVESQGGKRRRKSATNGSQTNHSLIS